MGFLLVCNSTCFSSTFYTNYYTISLRVVRVNACRRLVLFTSAFACVACISRKDRVADDVYKKYTVASQSVLRICSTKWKTKLIVLIYLGTKMSRFCLKIISFSSLESGLSFDSENSGISFDRALSTTVNYSYLELSEHIAIPVQVNIRNGKLDTKWRCWHTKSTKENFIASK